MLYFGIGDFANGTGVDGDLTTLAAKLGRVKPNGEVPSDNPFFDGDGPNNDRIWARGFRNPFTLSVQPSTGELWVNAVGASYEQVFRLSAGAHAGWDDYENSQPGDYLAPIIAYRTNGVDTRTISTAVRSAGVATFTTTPALTLRVGAKLTVTGASDPTFNGTGYVAATSSSAFSFAQAGPDATSSGGTATTEEIGGCITGGTFWDSSAPPPAYRGNFLFGDFNSQRVERVRLDANNAPVAVDHFATNVGNIVDTDLGPDGNLYFARFAGSILRTRFLAASQGIVVSRLHRRGREGGAVFFHVRLAQEPATSVSVTVARTGGDSDVAVASGSTLTFDSANWSSPQPVELTLAEDADTLDDSATVSVASPGLATETVRVSVIDDDVLAIVLSTTALGLEEGGEKTFDVSLSGPPGGDAIVSVARESGDATVTVVAGATLEFSDSTWSTPQAVTVGAAQDTDVDNTAAVLSISASGLATRHLTVSVTDDDPSAPAITSLADTSAVQGSPYGYDVGATGLPAPSFSLDTAPDGMSIDAGSGLIVWTPSGLGDFAVSVRATNGVAPDATQSFVLVVVADQAPVCSLTAPAPNAVVSGTASEFFGDVSDDVGTTHAEFSFDGVPAYDDVNPSGHYHLGGTHLKFDTTVLDDGVHVLRMTGYDTSGKSCSAEVSVLVDNDEDTAAGGAGGEAAAGGAGAAGEGVGGGATTGGSTGAGGSADGEAGAEGEPELPPGTGGTNDGTGGTESALAGRAPAATGGVSGASGKAASSGGSAGARAGAGNAGRTGRSAGKAAGCACRAAQERSDAAMPFLLAALALASVRRRRRGRVSAPELEAPLL
jgi:MYXO-CTERM domain-containing protein